MLDLGLFALPLELLCSTSRNVHVPLPVVRFATNPDRLLVLTSLPGQLIKFQQVLDSRFFFKCLLAIQNVSILLATMQNDFFLATAQNFHFDLDITKPIMAECFGIQVKQLCQHFRMCLILRFLIRCCPCSNVC